MGKQVKRSVICEDAIVYLQKVKNVKAIVTSLPDMEEIGCKDEQEWIDKINLFVRLIIDALDPKGIVIFYQTDRKFQGTVIDKKFFISERFHSFCWNLILSKIVLKQQPGTKSIFRPTYSNLFGFSKTMKVGPKLFPDVVYAGDMVYDNAMGSNAANLAIDFIKTRLPDCDTVLDPFCGRGSILLAANNAGLSSIGVDISADQVKAARLLK